MIITIENIKPIYDIDTNGIITNLQTNRIIMGSYDKDGYKRCHLKLNDNTGKTFRIHRLVLATYCYRPDYNILEVNHKDCNRANNALNNLEWCTSKENNQYRLKRNNNNHVILSEKECHKICMWLEKGYTPLMIAQKFYPNEIKRYANIIYDIKRGKNWQNISSQYNISAKEKYPNFKSNYTIFQIEKICKLITKNYTNKQIAHFIFNDYNKKYANLISNIRNKKKYRNVSVYYF